MGKRGMDHTGDDGSGVNHFQHPQAYRFSQIEHGDTVTVTRDAIADWRDRDGKDRYYETTYHRVLEVGRYKLKIHIDGLSGVAPNYGRYVINRSEVKSVCKESIFQY